MDELAFVLHRGPDLDMECFLNLQTGEILYIPTDTVALQSMFDSPFEPELMNVKALAEDILRKETALLYIPDNFQLVVFDLMNGFTSIDDLDEIIQEKLITAIRGAGGFDSFHQILRNYPDLLRKFVEFRDQFYLERAYEWLEENGILPIDPEPPSFEP